MHSLLRRQIRRCFGEEDTIPPGIDDFLYLVDCAYIEFDGDRAMLERSIDLSSQELLQANADMRAILRAFPDIVFRVDSSGVILDCRGGSPADFSLAPERLIGRKITDVPNEAAAEVFREALHQVVETSGPLTFEYSIPIGDRVTHNEARIIPVGSGELIVVVRNITGQKETAAELDRQRTYLRNVIDINPHMVFAKDQSGRFTLANRATADMYGRTVDELTGSLDHGVNGRPEEAERIRSDDRDVIDGRREVDIPAEPVIDARGEEHWLSVVKRPIPSPDGQEVHALGVATDITQRIRAERQLEERTERILRQQQELHELAMLGHTGLNARFEAIARSASRTLDVRRVGIWLFDKGNSVLSCCCLVDDGTISKPASPLTRASHPEYFRAVDEGRAVATPDARFDPRTAEFRECYLEPLGITAMLDVPVRASGELLGIVCHEQVGPPREWTPEDINFASSIADFAAHAVMADRRRQLEDDLRQSQKMQAIGSLVGGIAHDFNNLLTAINGESQLLLMRGRLEEDATARLELILETGNRAAALTRKLLSFSRKEDFRPVSSDLGAIVEAMVPMMSRLVGEDIRFNVESAPKLPRVLADPGQMEQALLNLVVNARDAMADGGTLTIRTGVATDPPGAVFLQVSDTGCGMTDEVRKKAFEAFYTTKTSGQGTGLGLSTVQAIVKQNKGSIRVNSEIGKGTTFTVTLMPLNREAACAETPAVEEPTGETAGRTQQTVDTEPIGDVKPAGDLEPIGDVKPASNLEPVGDAEPVGGTETATAAATGTAPSPDPATILVCEDETQVRSVVRQVLGLNGYTVLDAASPDEAIEIVRSHPGDIALLLTDVIMPGMNGRDLHEAVVTIRPSIPVLYMSGYSEGVLSRQGRLDPDTKLIQKPFTFDDLLDHVRAALDPPREGTEQDGRIAA